MENEHFHLPLDIAHILGYILMFVTLGYIIIFGAIQGKSITTHIKGANGKWDAPEVIIIIWLFLFPPMIIADLFLGFHASDNAWYSMELILLFALSGKAGLAYLNKPKTPKHKSNEG